MARKLAMLWFYSHYAPTSDAGHPCARLLEEGSPLVQMSEESCGLAELEDSADLMAAGIEQALLSLELLPLVS